MPNIVNPTADINFSQVDVPKDEYREKYPNGLNLTPGKDDHTKLVNMVMERAKIANDAIKRKYEYWEEIDKSMTAYVDLSTAEENVKEKDERKPVSLVIPLSFATVETLLTYFASVFLDDPIFRYSAVEPGDIVKAGLTEHLIGRQSRFAKMGLNLHTQFRDSFVYGFGISAPSWMEKYGFVTKRKPMQQFMNLVRSFVNVGTQTTRERTLIYEGNELSNIDPYMSLPDPNESIHDIQKGEFFGWIQKTNYNNLLEEELDEDDVFNVMYLKAMRDGRTRLTETKDNRDKKLGREDHRDANLGRPVDVINMFIKLVPSDYGLSDSERPEKWFFRVAADGVLISAKEMGLDHDMFPVSVCAPDYDGYSVTPISRLEILQPMQGALDWFISSHITNVRKAINDVVIVDPYMINVPDLKDPGPGGIVRLRKAAWGRGVKDAVMQLNVTDITRGHVTDAMIFMDLIQKIGGTDVLQTVRRNTSERVSATEARNDISNFVSKMGRMARVAGMQAIQDLAFMLASHTSQLMTQDTFVSTVGRYQDVLEAEYGTRAPVTPADIVPYADIDMHDGSAPGTENTDAMISFMQIAMKDPMLAQEFDIPRVFKAVARASGFKNVHEFVRRKDVQAQVQTPEQIDQGVQQGNLVAADVLAGMGGNGGF